MTYLHQERLPDSQTEEAIREFLRAVFVPQREQIRNPANSSAIADSGGVGGCIFLSPLLWGREKEPEQVETAQREASIAQPDSYCADRLRLIASKKVDPMLF
jgi:hypothetical protein